MSIFVTLKVSNDLVQSKVDWGIFLYEEYPIIVARLKAKWHLKFMPIGWALSTVGQDYIHDMQTLKYTFRHFRG